MKQLKDYTNAIQPTTNLPYGTLKDESSIGAGDGTPILAEQVQDIMYFLYQITNLGGVTPSGNLENATTVRDGLTALSRITDLKYDSELTYSAGSIVWVYNSGITLYYRSKVDDNDSDLSNTTNWTLIKVIDAEDSVSFPTLSLQGLNNYTPNFMDGGETMTMFDSRKQYVVVGSPTYNYSDYSYTFDGSNDALSYELKTGQSLTTNNLKMFWDVEFLDSGEEEGIFGGSDGNVEFFILRRTSDNKVRLDLSSDGSSFDISFQTTSAKSDFVAGRWQFRYIFNGSTHTLYWSNDGESNFVVDSNGNSIENTNKVWTAAITISDTRTLYTPNFPINYGRELYGTDFYLDGKLFLEGQAIISNDIFIIKPQQDNNFQSSIEISTYAARDELNSVNFNISKRQKDTLQASHWISGTVPTDLSNYSVVIWSIEISGIQDFYFDDVDGTNIPQNAPRRYVRSMKLNSAGNIREIVEDSKGMILMEEKTVLNEDISEGGSVEMTLPIPIGVKLKPILLVGIWQSSSALSKLKHSSSSFCCDGYTVMFHVAQNSDTYNTSISKTVPTNDGKITVTLEQGNIRNALEYFQGFEDDRTHKSLLNR